MQTNIFYKHFFSSIKVTLIFFKSINYMKLIKTKSDKGEQQL